MEGRGHTLSALPWVDNGTGWSGVRYPDRRREHVSATLGTTIRSTGRHLGRD